MSTSHLHTDMVFYEKYEQKKKKYVFLSINKEGTGGYTLMVVEEIPSHTM